MAVGQPKKGRRFGLLGHARSISRELCRFNPVGVRTGRNATVGRDATQTKKNHIPRNLNDTWRIYPAAAPGWNRCLDSKRCRRGDRLEGTMPRFAIQNAVCAFVAFFLFSTAAHAACEDSRKVRLGASAAERTNLLRQCKDAGERMHKICDNLPSCGADQADSPDSRGCCHHLESSLQFRE